MKRVQRIGPLTNLADSALHSLILLDLCFYCSNEFFLSLSLLFDKKRLILLDTIYRVIWTSLQGCSLHFGYADLYLHLSSFGSRN